MGLLWRKGRRGRRARYSTDMKFWSRAEVLVFNRHYRPCFGHFSSEVYTLYHLISRTSYRSLMRIMQSVRQFKTHVHFFSSGPPAHLPVLFHSPLFNCSIHFHCPTSPSSPLPFSTLTHLIPTPQPPSNIHLLLLLFPLFSFHLQLNSRRPPRTPSLRLLRLCLDSLWCSG